ncbi:HEAT repeats [uncultured archaeon]|nr:HEAT repeats [uncultured archaeon]
MRFKEGDERDEGRLGDIRKARQKMPKPKPEGRQASRSALDKVVFRFKEVGSRDPEVRSNAMDRLCRMGEDAVPVLSDILNDPTTATRVAKRILDNGYFLNGRRPIHAEGPEADPEILRGKIRSIRSASALLLGKIGAHLDATSREGIAKTLMPALKDQSHEIRYWAASAYWRLGESGHAALPQLLAVVRDRGEMLRVRHSALDAVGGMDFAAKPAINTLLGIAKDTGENESIRRAAVELLGELGKYAEGKDQKTDLCDTLLDRLGEENACIANAALSASVILEGVYVNELIALTRNDDKSERARVNAVWALVGIGMKKDNLFEFVASHLKLMKEISEDPESKAKPSPELMSTIDNALSQLNSGVYTTKVIRHDPQADEGRGKDRA